MLEICEMSNFYKPFSNRRLLKLYIRTYLRVILLTLTIVRKHFFFQLVFKIVKIALILSCLIGLNIQLPAWLTVFFLICGEGDLLEPHRYLLYQQYTLKLF